MSDLGPLQIGKTRVRQHVNPLKTIHQLPSKPLKWQETFEDPSLPLIIDLGCGSGRFLMVLQKQHSIVQKKYNYLGIEIRKAVRMGRFYFV
jgi:tRNA (guanine-N7-)-methyltransferase